MSKFAHTILFLVLMPGIAAADYCDPEIGQTFQLISSGELAVSDEAVSLAEEKVITALELCKSGSDYSAELADARKLLEVE